jgi:hypothetical protein
MGKLPNNKTLFQDAVIATAQQFNIPEIYTEKVETHSLDCLKWNLHNPHSTNRLNPGSNHLSNSV